MPVAYAREMDYDNQIVLDNKNVVIEKVHVTGLNRTKGDYIMDDLKPVFNAKSFLEAYESSLECRSQLLSKGLFQSVDVFIDTTEAYEKNCSDGVQVLFKVKERSLICGEVKTEMSNHEKPRWVMRVLSPNVFGRGETLSTSFSHSLNTSDVSRFYQPNDFSTSFSKPFRDSSKLQISLIKEKVENPWSSFNETVRGLQVGHTFPLLGNRHSLEWLGHWRECSCSGGNAAFDVRQQMGHSLKSSIQHSLVIDHTDSTILPKSGIYFKLSEEIAGLGGDVKFVKETIDSSIHATLFEKVTLGLGVQGGIMFPYGKPLKTCINDRFFIGGPLTLRGFEINSVGNESSGTFVGSTAYWMVGGHIYTPLPFCWSRFGQGSWLDDIRMHGFLNAGNGFNFKVAHAVSNSFQLAKTDVRVSCGLGVVYKFLNRARLELNFCVPLRAKSTDKVCHGLQFGIGVSYV